MTHTDTRQPQTTLTNHSFIESLASSGAAWVTISKHIYNIYIILSINYTISIHDDSFLVKAKKNPDLLVMRTLIGLG